MKSGNKRQRPLIDKRLAVALCVMLFLFFLGALIFPPVQDPYVGSVYMKESRSQLQFYGKYRSYFKLPNARSEYFVIIKLDSFDFQGNYIIGRGFPTFKHIHYGLAVKDSILLQIEPVDVIKTFKLGGVVYTTFGDSLLHFQLKDGSFYSN